MIYPVVARRERNGCTHAWVSREHFGSIHYPRPLLLNPAMDRGTAYWRLASTLILHHADKLAEEM